MEIQSIGLAGLEKAQEKLAAVAKRLSGAGISGGGASSEKSSSADVVDLSAEMVALLEAKNASGANLKAVETANELASQTFGAIDVFG